MMFVGESKVLNFEDILFIWCVKWLDFFLLFWVDFLVVVGMVIDLCLEELGMKELMDVY